jgi:NADPH:quinone reductase-like Zn-dependent oxidoreductase
MMKLGSVELGPQPGFAPNPGEKFNRSAASYWPRWTSGQLSAEVVDQLGCTRDGWLSEYLLLDEQAAVRVPDHLSWAEAAALPCAGLTAWNSLTRGGALRPGHTVLTLGSGDVALFAIQFAKLMGCRVIATTSSDAKADRLRRLGADDVIDYLRVPEWSKEVQRLTDGAGADLLVETSGPATIGQSLRAAARYGHVVLLTVVSPEPGVLRITEGDLAGKLVTIRREFVGNRTELEAMIHAISTHRLTPVIDRQFDFDDAIDAYRSYAEEDSFGKVVIRIGGQDK